MGTEKLNPFMDMLNTMIHFVMLNVIFLLTCLPVFTTGAALASLYYVLIKELKGEYGYVTRTYLKELKRNFKTGTAAFFILFLTGALLLFNLLFWPAQGNGFSYAVTGLLAALTVIWLTISHYTYPLIGRFVNTPVQSIKNAWGLAIRNLKTTGLLLAMDACIVCFLLFSPMKLLLLALPLCGVVLPAYLRAKILAGVFAPYENDSED